MLISSCEKTVDLAYVEKHVRVLFPCYDVNHNLHSSRKLCNKFILEASILSETPLSFPDDVGTTLDPVTSPILLIEAHIVNPTNHDINVSVTLRLWITSKFVNFKTCYYLSLLSNEVV